MKKVSNLISIGCDNKIFLRIEFCNTGFIPGAASWNKTASWPHRFLKTVDSTSNQGP